MLRIGDGRSSEVGHRPRHIGRVRRRPSILLGEKQVGAWGVRARCCLTTLCGLESCSDWFGVYVGQVGSDG